MSKEQLARSIVLLLVISAIAIPVAAWQMRSSSMVVHARMAETGGWTPENLTAVVGEPVHLQLTSDDVMHGFAVGQTDMSAVDVVPGEISEVTLNFDRPGKYTFYCTRWCSVNHWRMRGTIEVSGSGTTSETVIPPLYITLGLDIDGEHHAEVIPDRLPSAARGLQAGADLPAEYLSREYYLSHSPVEAWKALRGEKSFSEFSDQDLWDQVAEIWQTNTSPRDLEIGRQLYTTNCAACHGETGAGDGIFADQLEKSKDGEHPMAPAGEMTMRPSNFTDPEHMLSASPAHLQGKIQRGGMGTGMPYWGPIFTEEQTWSLVAYIWTFQFDLEDLP